MIILWWRKTRLQINANVAPDVCTLSTVPSCRHETFLLSGCLQSKFAFILTPHYGCAVLPSPLAGMGSFGLSRKMVEISLIWKNAFDRAAALSKVWHMYPFDGKWLLSRAERARSNAGKIGFGLALMWELFREISKKLVARKCIWKHISWKPQWAQRWARQTWLTEEQIQTDGSAIPTGMKFY